MPDIFYEILIMLTQLVRFLGMAVFGVAFGWLAVDLLKKTTFWQVQIAIFLGVAALTLGLTMYAGIGALGAYMAGLGVAIFIWGLPRKPKEEKKDK
jgi:NhaP-type Na+/H+ or K+/H+ antiporter